MKFLTLTLLTLLPFTAFASGSSARGGGDEVALEFQTELAAALKQITANLPELASSLGSVDLAATAREAQIIVVDTPLTVEKDGVEQYSIAENDPAQQLILINRTRWITIEDPHLKQAVALHEVASLKGLEHTGAYPISSRYLAAFGIQEEALVPITAACMAPASEASSCKKQMPDYIARLFVVKNTNVYTDTNGNVAQDGSSWRGQEVMFYDESKKYVLDLFDRSGQPNQPAGTLQIAEGQPAGSASQTLDQGKTIDFWVLNGKIHPQTTSQQYLENSAGGDASNETFSAFPKNSANPAPSASSVSDTIDAKTGIEVKTATTGNLKRDVGHGFTQQSQSLMYIYKPWPVASFEAELDPSSRAELIKFIATHSAVLKIKHDLNLCLRQAQNANSSCSDLRQAYERADRARDAEFLALSAPIRGVRLTTKPVATPVKPKPTKPAHRAPAPLPAREQSEPDYDYPPYPNNAPPPIFRPGDYIPPNAPNNSIVCDDRMSYAQCAMGR